MNIAPGASHTHKSSGLLIIETEEREREVDRGREAEIDKESLVGEEGEGGKEWKKKKGRVKQVGQRQIYKQPKTDAKKVHDN